MIFMSRSRAYLRGRRACTLVRFSYIALSACRRRMHLTGMIVPAMRCNQIPQMLRPYSRSLPQFGSVCCDKRTKDPIPGGKATPTLHCAAKSLGSPRKPGEIKTTSVALTEIAISGTTMPQFQREWVMRTSANLMAIDSMVISGSGKIIEELEARGHALKVAELAQLLGVSRKHVYKMAAQSSLPSFRIGRAVRFDPKQVAEWLKGKMPQRVRPTSLNKLAV